MHGGRLDFERKPSLTRSQTDSNITYMSDEVPEAPGSGCYITKEGDIDYQVVLKVKAPRLQFLPFMHASSFVFFRPLIRSHYVTILVARLASVKIF